MKTSTNLLLSAMIILSSLFSCSENKDVNKNFVINYSKIDSSLNNYGYSRIDESWMKKRNLLFKEKGLDTLKGNDGILTIHTDWTETGINVLRLDDDSINDYIVICKSLPQTKIKCEYSIIAILGRTYKCYFIDGFPLSEYDETVLRKFESFEKNYGTQYELPCIGIGTRPNSITNSFGYSMNRWVDFDGPNVYDSDLDTFKRIAIW